LNTTTSQERIPAADGRVPTAPRQAAPLLSNGQARLLHGALQLETSVLIIGGGATGAGLARDLALRSVPCILVEQGDLNSGASGANHGLLHSGARYVAQDAEAARECRDEGLLLKRLAPHCIEDCGGLFVAVRGDDERYVRRFPELCRSGGIQASALSPREALELEPSLSPDLIAAFSVDDAVIDPFRLTLDNIAHAVSLGSAFLPRTGVVGFDRKAGKIIRTRVRDMVSGTEREIRAEQVVIAAGAWSGILAGMAGLSTDMVLSKGTLLVTHDRISGKVINRLRPATDADILVPGGTVSILGTTSVRVDDPNGCRPTVGEVDLLIDQGSAMVPRLGSTRFIRAFAGVRPLAGRGNAGDDRGVSRGFALVDHSKDGVDNLVTITGGKLTTHRLMAERTADLVCAKLGIDAACRTAAEPLPSSACGRWTEPGLAPREWLRKGEPGDQIVCECELVPRSTVDQVLESMPQTPPGSILRGVGLRSRLGKGSCQGGLCSLRLSALLYDRGLLASGQGVEEIRSFLNERWRGVHPLLWGFAAIQAEFQEALHCGLLGLELPAAPSGEGSDDE
jgi:glycerol-3-phosphate dehydrogenase